MTVFYGYDISNWQKGFNPVQAASEGFTFAFIKCSEGANFTDPFYSGFADAHKKAGILFAAYHFVTIDPIPQQVQRIITSINANKNTPIMLDLEPASTRPDYSFFTGITQGLKNLGFEVRFSYIPRWYWEQIGQPDISAAPNIVASNYVTGSGYASTLASQIRADQWAEYGGGKPRFLQFSDRASIAGMSVDADLFIGTRDELESIFTVHGKHLAPVVTTQPVATAQNTHDDTGEMLRLLGDIREQLTGDREIGYKGWPQLDGKTLVDAISDLMQDIHQIKEVFTQMYTGHS